MERSRRFVGLIFVLVALVGCEKKRTTTESAADAHAASAATPEAIVAGPTPATQGGPPADGGSETKHGMSNCPTTVPGAEVAIKDVPGGVEMSITAEAESAAKDIRERMNKLALAARANEEAGVRHSGKGEGGGIYGRCPVVMRNTKLETTDLPKGVRAIVKASDASEIDWLRRETRDRDRQAKTPEGEHAGTMRMAKCPSAVSGAKTVVKDGKDGVVVTVTGPEGAATDIRERARHVAEAAKKAAAPKPEHTGTGSGGGKVGRCPVVLEGATGVTVKDVDGGAEITVSAAEKDVAALRKEAKARAANFPAK